MQHIVNRQRTDELWQSFRNILYSSFFFLLNCIFYCGHTDFLIRSERKWKSHHLFCLAKNYIPIFFFIIAEVRLYFKHLTVSSLFWSISMNQFSRMNWTILRRTNQPFIVCVQLSGNQGVYLSHHILDSANVIATISFIFRIIPWIC